MSRVLFEQKAKEAKERINAKVTNETDRASQYFKLGKELILKYKQIKIGLDCTREAKEILDAVILEKHKADIFKLDQVCRKKKVSTDERNLYYEILHFESYYLFDSYMLYLEKDRVDREKFYEPKRPQLLKHNIPQSLQDLEDDLLDILSISMPPGTGKTSIEKFFMSWVIGRHPEDYNLFYSHSSSIDKIFYDGVLSICTEPEYNWKEIFPDVILRKTDAQNLKFDFGKNKPFWSIQTTSVGANNAGVVRCNRYLCCDDIIAGIEEALNINILDKRWTQYSVDARQRKLNQRVKELHIATRWSVHDIIGRLKNIYQNNPRARFIAIPDIDPVTNESNFNYKYNGMSVEFFNNQELLMDEISYRCLYKNEPVEREGLLYHEDDLRRFLDIPTSEPDAIWGICDTKSKGTDFLFLPVAYQYGQDYYIVDCVCTDSSDYGVQYGRMADLLINNNVQQCEFESNAGGDRVAVEVQKLVDAGGGRCHITTKPTETNKETRIIVNADWVKKHCLFKSKEMYSPHSDYGIMMKWLLSYSVASKNPHDDVPDGMANLALFVTRGARVAKVEAIHNPYKMLGY